MTSFAVPPSPPARPVLSAQSVTSAFGSMNNLRTGSPRSVRIAPPGSPTRSLAKIASMFVSSRSLSAMALTGRTAGVEPLADPQASSPMAEPAEEREFLYYGDTIALFASEAKGYLTASALHPQSLEVLVGPRGDLPYNFELCIFSLHPANDGPSTTHHSGGGKDQQETPILYGDTVRIFHEYSEQWLRSTHIMSTKHLNCFDLGFIPQVEGKTTAATSFKIMPSRKLRRPGDKVRPQDQVLFTSEFDGQYIYCNPSEVIEQQLSEWLPIEASTAPKPCTWFIEPCDEGFKAAKAVQEQDVIRIRDIVGLLHKEAEAMLVCSPFEVDYDTGLPKITTIDAGPVEPGEDDAATADRNLSFMPVSDSHTFDPARASISSNSLWIVEHVARNKGGPIHPRVPYLLRHLSSDRYLTVVSNPMTSEAQFVLSVSPDSVNGLFTFIPADAGATQVTSSSYFQIQHSSGLWLHACFTGRPNGDNPGPTPSAATINANANFNEEANPAVAAKLSSIPVYGDAIMVFRPATNPKILLQLIRPHVHQLHKYITHFRSKNADFTNPETQRVIENASSALGSLIVMCTQSEDQDPLSRVGVPIVENQRVLIDENVHLVVLDLLQAPFGSSKPLSMCTSPQELMVTPRVINVDEFKPVHATCVLGYRLLKQMAFGNPTFACKLAPYIPFMLTQMGCKFRVSDTLNEMFLDNMALSKRVTEDVLRGYVKHAEANNNQLRYAKFLSGVALCQGQNMLLIQDLVCRLVLEESPHLIVKTKLEDETVRVEVSANVKPTDIKAEKDKEGKPIPVPEEGFKKGTWLVLDTYCKQVPHSVAGNFEQLLVFLSRVSLNNSRTRAVVNRVFPREILSAVLCGPNHSKLPDKWKALFYDIATSVCVSYPPVKVIVWSGNDAGMSFRKPMSPDSPRSRSPQLALSVKTVSETFDGGSPKWWQTTSAAGQDRFIQTVIEKSLELLEKNVQLFANKKDRCKLIQSVLRMFQQFSRSDILTGPQKVRLLKTLMQMDGSLDREDEDKKDVEPKAKSPLSPPSLARFDLPLITDGPKGWDRFDFSDQNKMLVLTKCEVCETLSTLLDNEIWKAVHEIISRFTDYYIDTPVIEQSKFLADMTDIVEDCGSSPTVFNMSQLTAMLMQFVQYRMDELVTKALSLLTRFNSFRSEVCKKLREVVVFQKWHPELLEQVLSFRRLVAAYAVQKGGLGESEVEAAISVIHDLSNWLRYNPGDHSSVPFVRGCDGKDENLVLHYQNYFRSAKVHETVAELIKQYRVPKLLRAALDLLTLFCTNSSTNQEAIFTCLGAMLGWINVTECGEFLMEMFRNNYSLCNKISKALVVRCVEALNSPDVTKESFQQTAAFLKQVVVVNGIPLARNQTLVMHALAERYHFQELSSIAQVDGRMPEMVLVRSAALVDLMFMCTKGFNPTTESLARGIVPTQKIVRILAASENPIPLRLQLPYIRLLIEVFFLAYAGAGSANTTGAGGSSTEAKMAQQLFERWTDEGIWTDIMKRFILVLKSDQAQGESPAEEHIEFVCEGIYPYMTSFFAKIDRRKLHSKPKVMEIFQEAGKLAVLFAERLPASSDRQYAELVNLFLKTILTDWDLDDDTAERATQCLNKRVARQDRRGSQMSSELDRGFEEFQRHAASTLCTSSVDDVTNFASQLKPFFMNQAQVKKAMSFRGSFVTQKGPGTAIAIKIFSCLKDNYLPERVTVSMLEVVTAIIREHEDDEGEKLSAVQRWFMSLGSVPVLPCLVQTGTPAVVRATIKFGIALLHGGNKHIQDSLLHFLCSADQPFFETLALRVQKATTTFKQTKAERDFLKSYFAEKAYKLSEEQKISHRRMLDRTADVGDIADMLRLLQLFCEGHHLKFQNYVRHQQHNWRTFNMVSETVLFLRELLHVDMDDNLLDTAIQGFNTLTEFCQGPCVENQNALVRTNICGEISEIFTNSFEHCSDEKISALQNTATGTLLSLLEACRSNSLPSLMINELSVKGIGSALKQMVQRYNAKVAEIKTDAEREELAGDVFNLFIFVYMLERWTHNEELKQLLNHTPGIQTFHDMLGIIEIQRDGENERVYFCRPTISRMLTDEKKESLLKIVDRTSAASKVADFYVRAKVLISEMEFAEEAKLAVAETLNPIKITNPYLESLREYVVEHLTGSGVSFGDSIVIYLSILINIIMVLNDRYHHWTLYLVFLLLGLVQLITVAGVCCLVASLDLTLTIATNNETPLPKIGEFWPPRLQLTSLWELDMGEKARFLYYPSMGFLNLLGLFVSPYFFSVQVLSVVRKSEILRNVTLAVSTTFKSLFLTMVLAMVVLYVFTVAGYALFSSDFVTEEGEKLCTDLLQCVIFTLSNGLRNGGGVGDVLLQPDWDSPHYNYRVAYDLLFFACINIGLINMVFGIIIDAFAELRDERQSREEDQTSQCFICGLGADIYNRNMRDGFERHVKREHNMWDYLHFMHHLKRKAVDEYTGQESYVAEMINRNDTNFFPLGREESIGSGDHDAQNQKGGDGAGSDAGESDTEAEVMEFGTPRNKGAAAAAVALAHSSPRKK